ncbi:hypothetical protein [Alkalilimnicola ehrlichii]|uniref:hypothetical protein n=1 Tax=Alkalilimnicola ehrlichii TaxID=351052 RepID=UPI003BA076CA
MAFSLMGIITVVLEVFRGVLPFVLLWVVVDLVLLGLFFARKSSRSVNLALPVKASVGVGAVVAVVAFIMLPGFTGASFANLSGALDYLSLIGGSIGFGVAFGVLAFPPLLYVLGLGPSESHAGTTATQS